MRKIIKFGTVLVAASMLFTGCGSPMMSLTEDEENIVVNYSAGILAKHNGYQQEGLTAVYPEETEEIVEPEEEEELIEEAEEELEEGAELEEEEEGMEDSAGEASDEADGQMTLTEALSIPGVEFSYHDYSTSTDYREGDIFSLSASEGNVLLILNVNMTNIGSEAVECNLMSKQISYTLRLNEGSVIGNHTTILTNDMSTYQGTLDPGQTEAVILLFDVPENVAADISSMQLSVQMNGETANIIL